MIRCDTRPSSGGGHLARCAAIARELSRHKAKVVFAFDQAGTDMMQEVISAGHDIVAMHGADESRHLVQMAAMISRPCLLLVDHYEWGCAQERAARSFANFIGVVDDVPKRAHDADILVDPAGGFSESAWREFAKGATVLSNPMFAIVRRDVREGRSLRAAPRAHGEPMRLMISFGKADIKNATSFALRAAARALPGSRIDVAISGGSPSRSKIEQAVMSIEANVALHVDSDRYIELLANADLAIGAGGVSAFERAYLGVPSLAIRTAENQAGSIRSLAARGCIFDMGPLETMTEDRLTAAITDLAADDSVRTASGNASAELIDGRGAERIASALIAVMEQGRT